MSYQQNIMFDSLLNYNILYDYDNNGYTSVTIGGYEWTVQNYRTTHYSNGNDIVRIDGSVNWLNDVSGGYCEYDNSIGLYKNPYGYLYNWYAVDNSNGFVYLKRNGVRETDWRVPTLADYSSLRQYAGGESIAGSKLKETGYTHWDSPNMGATNEYGLSILGAGCRSGIFYQYIKQRALLWTSSRDEGSSTYQSHYANLYYNVSTMDVGVATAEHIDGLSIRCVRDIFGTPILSFVTNASTTAFTPQVITSAGTTKWNLGDASYNENSNVIKHSYSIAGNKYVNLYKGTTDGSSAITSINVTSCSLIGTLDMSCLVNLGGDFGASGNPNLTKIINPKSSQTFTSYQIINSGLSGTLDVSGLTGMGGQFYVTGNTKLNYILNASNNQAYSLYYVWSNGLMGTLDMRPLSRFSTQFYANDNPSLNRVLFPSSSTNVTTVYVYACDMSGTLDISGLTNFGGYFRADNNPKLNYILNPSNNKTWSEYIANNCGLMGTLDLRKLAALGGDIEFRNNPSLNTILNPNSSTAITQYSAYYCGLNGTLDVSRLTGLGGSFQVYGNSNLTKILNPTSSQTFTEYRVDDCSLNGTLDISGLTNFGGAFYCYNNLNLTKIIFPSTTNLITPIGAYNCNLTGVLDISGLVNLSGSFQVYDNPNLNKILNPASSQRFVYYWAYNCSLNETLDVSGLTNLGGDFKVYNNRNLKRILLPTFNASIYNFYANDCSLDLFTVNDVLAKFDAYYSAHTPDTSVYIDLSGGRNMSPTGGWANTNIAHLDTIFSPPNDISIKINA